MQSVQTIEMFLLNEYSRNILHHVRPQTVASRVPGQTKNASMNESLKPTLTADKNECSSKFLMYGNHLQTFGRGRTLFLKFCER